MALPIEKCLKMISSIGESKIPIVCYIHEHKIAGVEDISKALGLRYQTAVMYLARLLKDQIVERIRKQANSFYCISPEFAATLRTFYQYFITDFIPEKDIARILGEREAIIIKKTNERIAKGLKTKSEIYLRNNASNTSRKFEQLDLFAEEIKKEKEMQKNKGENDDVQSGS